MASLEHDHADDLHNDELHPGCHFCEMAHLIRYQGMLLDQMESSMLNLLSRGALNLAQMAAYQRNMASPRPIIPTGESRHWVYCDSGIMPAQGEPVQLIMLVDEEDGVQSRTDGYRLGDNWHRSSDRSVIEYQVIMWRLLFGQVEDHRTSGTRANKPTPPDIKTEEPSKPLVDNEQSPDAAPKSATDVEQDPGNSYKSTVRIM